MADWILGADDVFGYEFSDLDLDEAARRAPLAVRAAWTGGMRVVTLYHGRVPTATSGAQYAAPNEPLRRELLAQRARGDWRTWSPVASKRLRITPTAITVPLRRNPKPSRYAFPDFETDDYMAEEN